MLNDASRILAVETSGRWGSVAIGTQAGVVARASLSAEMKHAAELMPAIDRMLTERGWPADSLTDVFVSVGPGSFTGLRIGVTLARTLGWSIGARVVAVPTLDALVRNALDVNVPPPHVAAVLDAKRNQVYAAAFSLRDGICTRIIDPCLEEPKSFLARCPRPIAVLGEGVAHHQAAIAESDADVLDAALWIPRAENVFHIGLERARSGLFTAPGDLLPFYIRRPEAEEKWEQLHPH